MASAKSSSRKPKRKQTRFRTHICGTYIRYVIRGRFQVRWYTPIAGSVNCGLCDEWTARRVREAIAAETGRYDGTALGIWKAAVAALDRLRAQGFPVPKEIWPKWVNKDKDGSFFARITKHGKRILLRPFDTPEAAHLAMLAKLKRLRKPKKKT
jgi:hypothetical protein